MSALSFKINAETDKLKSFISMLEQLRRVLADIPDSTKDFDVINRKIGEMEARVEQSMRKIAQMERQAMDAAAKTAASATIGNTGGDSTAGAQAAKAETAAYEDLISTLREAFAQKRMLTGEIERLKASNRALTAEYNSLTKAQKENLQLTDEQKSRRLELSLSLEQNKQELARYRKELVSQIKLEQTAKGSADEMAQALARMQAIYSSLNKSEQKSAWGQELSKNIEALDNKVKALDATMGIHKRNVGNYASGFNMLGFQIQQVARELPSLAYGPQIFFSAISNNLPMLADEISKARKSVEELKKTGQSFIPVWKQIAKSIISWQTLLVAGVTVLTLYGKEITSWVSNLFAADKSLDSVIKNIDQFNNQVTTSREELQREFRALSQAKKGTAEYALARQTIMDKYDKYLSKQRAEIQNLEDMRGAYEVLLRSVTATSVAKGLEEANANAATEYSEALNKAFEGVQAKFIAKFGKETGITYFTRFREGLQSGVPELEKEALEIYKMFEGAPDGMNVIDTWKEIFTGKAIGTTTHNALENSFNSAREATMRYNETLSANKVAMQALLDMYNISAEDIDKDGKATEDIVEQKKKEIAEIEKIVAKTPEEVAARNKKLETARKELKVLENLGLATKEQIELDNTRKQIQREMRDAGFEARQAEIDVMPEGIDKNIAQIELDYQKREAAIADGAERIRELQKKELSRGQRELIAARQQAIKALKNKEWDTAFLAEAGIKDPKTYLDDQLEAWNEYYMKYGTILEKIQATKEYYDKKISLAKDAGTAEALRAEKDAAMAALEIEGDDFVNSLISKTKEDIEKLKREIKAALKTLEDEFNKLPSSDSEQGDDLRNKINVLRAQLSAINKLDPVSDEEHSESFEKWQKLYSTLTKIEGQFNDIGEAAGGAMGEVISTASKITVNSLKMIDSIKTLAENSAEGIEKTGEVAATTIQKVERASVILAIIQAALKVIQSIASIFGDTETSMERNIREAQELNEELRVMNERARLNADAFKTVFGEDAFGNYVNNVTALTDAMNAYQATMDKITNRGKEKYVEFGTGNTGLANLWKDDFIWESVSESVANMMNQVQHSTWFRSAKYKKLKDVVPELFEESGVLNMQALKEFVEGNSDTFKHLSKENQTYLKELVNNWETYEEAIEAVNDYLNEMFGELGSTLTDALVDSFEQGTNAADAFGEAAGDMLKNLAKQVLYTATIGPEIEKAQKKIDAINRDLSLSNEERYNALAGVVDTMLDDVLAQQKVGQELWERLKQAAEERGLQWEAEAAGQEATSRGFQAMSQDTGDELNGRFTDIQGKVTDIRGYVMAMAQTGGIITAINNIATLGDRIDQMSVACYESLRFDAETLIEVREINSSTKNMDKTLARIEEGINSIKKNTESL
ncbi:hypothetical protein [Alistipes finegoldii]|uniref:hypothetical protein n=1 Tax=Alistipes finegoldii TaxID=214856 RepID=UPI00248D11F8|nr:hypothetical protein [Alistipes finegoldii]